MKTSNDAQGHIRWNNKKLPVLCGSRRIVNCLQYSTPLMPMQYVMQYKYYINALYLTLPSLLCLGLLFNFSNYNSVFIYHINTHCSL